MNGKTIFIFCLAAILTVGFSGCSPKGQSGENQGQQQAEDQQIREKVAEATRKAKEDSRIVARKADQAAKDLEHKARVVKQGVKEGWTGNSTSQTINLNSASEEDLQRLPGISQEDAEKIIRGRPYTNENELLNKKIISKAEFQRVEGSIAVK